MSAGRAALWASGHDETVEVNQRALIDKVLARYSGEFTVFRELLQNSDDAGSQTVEIRFETREYLDKKKENGTTGNSEVEGAKEDLPNLKTAVVHQWTFRNNGVPFRDEDWNRLKKIAEGNPDEEKIGAFGVGFYSLFSVTEDPFVTSGGQWMGFYWKGDQLLARRGALPTTSPSSDSNSWTSFEMTLRDPVPIPSAFDFTRFLCSSITFMAHLREVSVWFDDKRLARLTKRPGSMEDCAIPRGLKASSPAGVMSVKKLETTPLHIQAEVMRWVYSVGSEKPAPIIPKPQAQPKSHGGFFTSLFSSLTGTSTPSRSATPLPPQPTPPPVNLLEISESSVSLAIFAADVTVKLEKKLAAELYRSTKKNPPNRLRYELIYTGKDEYDQSKEEDDKYPYATGSVFQGLRADLEGTGFARIFIGHATAQTTGIGGHMAARFIPTVERESIDLVDRNVAVWNKELLYVGAFLCRSAYNIEMDKIRDNWNRATEPSTGVIDSAVQRRLMDRALHALKFFIFHPSTPSSTVSQLLQEHFFSCSVNQAFPLFSSAGVRDASEVRFPDPDFVAFLKQLPVIPDDIIVGASPLIDVLRTKRLLRDITFDDVLKELRARPLSEPELIACLKWWLGLMKSSPPTNYVQIRNKLLDAALLLLEKDQKPTSLASIKTFLNLRQMGPIIPTDGPLPGHLLPLSVSRNFEPEAIIMAFPWQELTLIEWLRYITSSAVVGKDIEHDLTKSPHWAERVLTSIARGWPSLPKTHQNEIVELITKCTCVPTNAGLKRAEETYFSSVNLFQDLPIVTFPSGTHVKGNVEKFLQVLGVRKHVDLQIIFDRMIKTGDWTINDLTKYLVSVQNTLSPHELDRLRMTPAFVKETDITDPVEKKKAPRAKAGDLYEPVDVLRQLKLPVLDWSTQSKWRSSSEEAKFMYHLGLRRYPPLNVIIELAAGPDPSIRPIARRYFLDNIVTRYPDYSPSDFVEKAFVPTASGTLAKPYEVYVNPEWAVLGFQVVDESIRDEAITKFKLMEHPPTSALVAKLEKTPPPDEATARRWFEVLANRVSAFSNSELRRLSEARIVPTAKDSEKGPRMLAPNQCYFMGKTDAQFHSKLFVFVDFGVRANSFLSACGTKQEPTVEEIARLMLESPRRFYELAEGRDNYLQELRHLAVHRRSIMSSTMTRMKRSPFLLGSRRVKKTKLPVTADAKLVPTDWDDEDWEYEYDLRRPEQIVVVDDINAFGQFGYDIFTAPQEDLLEGFYLDLGCRRLTSLVQENYRPSMEITNVRQARDIRALVLERLPLFLHEHTHQKPQVSYSWLNSEGNFVVRASGKLIVTKSMMYENKHLTSEREASAVARRMGRSGPIELWLATNSQIDMYEVATSLCLLLFQTYKANDALLFMTILSTDLKSLKRRGYNVDRILRQQQAEREAARNAAKEKVASMALVSDAEPEMPGGLSEKSSRAPPPVPALAPTSSDSTVAGPASRGPSPGPKRESLLDAVRRDRPNSTALNDSWQNIKRKFGARPELTDGLLPGSRPNAGLLPAPPTNDVTPLNNISSNIETAIQACREEKSSIMRNRQQMQTVKESLNEGYCDVSGHAHDLEKAGDMGGTPVYVSPDALQLYGDSDASSSKRKQEFMAAKHDSIARFIYVIRPLQEIYNLPAKSLHIFYDLSGELIAFNREGSLHLNLRYFEAWHDEDVRLQKLTKAYISWYFTLAHEIAHNLVQPHNSEHEFYFSAICEEHMMRFSTLLQS